MTSKGLYIHVPFCVRKCPYCDFYSVTDMSLTERYTEAVKRNILSKNICADTVYFGGGTPSLLSAKQIYEILSSAEITDNAEVTMECNPNTVTAEYLAEIFQAGVNRISFGIQSLDDGELKLLGRIHNAETAVNAVNLAYKSGFCNISADLMLATAGQTAASLKNSIERLAALPINHVSAYMLKIEQETPYGRSNSIASMLPDEDETADMYLMTVEMLEKYGFKQYEISNFAQPGFESKHNLKYWRCEEYYGIGPSAHSYINGVRKACPKSVSDFIASEIQQEYVTEECGGDDEERTMLSLRLTNDGLNLELLAEEQRNEVVKRSKPLIAAGYIVKRGERLTLTPKGCLVSNEIICQLTL